MGRNMTRLVLLFVTMMIALAGVATAQDAPVEPDRKRLGFGILANNDFFGDGHDRWQSGSVSSSRIYGPGWYGTLPQTPGEIVEYRFQGRIISPANTTKPEDDDRPYAASLALGTHTHFAYGLGEISLGADLVFSGANTGVSNLQSEVHEMLNMDALSTLTVSDQIPNGLHPTVVLEYGQSVNLGSGAEIRPFAELRGGDETLFRSGVDLYFGEALANSLLVRDQVTGQRYQTARDQEASGVGFVLGGDFAHMESSIYLPDGLGSEMTDNRTRVRAGVLWQDKGNSVFYGMTWLSEEFTSQPEPQVVGSIRISFEF